ncbi:MAG: hypothetical protein IKU86_01480 [Thermoguttaceae bacterium]|nr:hypothetical protein [Thermoguttaceae bacterium]
MTKRGKNDDVFAENSTNMNEKSAKNANDGAWRRRLTAALLVVAALSVDVGCVRGTKCFLRRGKNVVVENVDPLARTETVLCVDGRVERMRFAKNGKRVLVELRDFDEPSVDAYLDFFESGGRRTADFVASNARLELWNVEFLEARPEPFDAANEVGVESAVFDEAGGRVFWTAREFERSGAFATETSGEIDGGIASVAAATAVDAETFAARDAAYRTSATFIPATRNALATRAFARTSLTADAEDSARLKISDEAKSAESIWLSPNARWIVARAGTIGETAGDAASLTPGEWSLTLRRDRRRVVRFPKSVKMTFAESTSNETIEGRVVDALAVSDAGDLIATLVEETPPSRANGEKTRKERARVAAAGSEKDGEFNGRADFVPRFKIVVWDLSVPESVDWEKAKKPLQALEVAQIAVAGPVSRRFCRFSPNGQIFAARIDPRYVTLWQSASGRLLGELGEHKNDVADFAFSPNGVKVATTTGLGKRVILWDVRKGAATRALDETSADVAEIDAVAFSSDGGSVYFANDLGEIKRWDARAERRAVAPEKR